MIRKLKPGDKVRVKNPLTEADVKDCFWWPLVPWVANCQGKVLTIKRARDEISYYVEENGSFWNLSMFDLSEQFDDGDVDMFAAKELWNSLI